MTPQKQKLIHVAKRELCMDDDTYRLLLWNLFKKKSSKELSDFQVDQLISHFKKSGFKVRKTKVCSIKLWRKINAMKPIVKWKQANGFDKWMRSKFGFAKPGSDKDAIKVIEGLKQMIDRQLEKDFGEGWLTMSYDKYPRIRTYMAYHHVN